MTTTDATGQDADNSVPEAIALPENRSVTVTAREHYGNTDISVAAQLERIRASGAQAMILWTTGTAFGTALRSLRDTGMEIPVYTSQGNLVYAQLEGYKSSWPATEPILMGGIPSIVPEAIPDRAIRRSIDRYLAAMKAVGIERPDVGVAIAWDSANIAVEAFRRLGFDASPAQVRDYINGITDWPGIYGSKLQSRATARHSE